MHVKVPNPLACTVTMWQSAKRGKWAGAERSIEADGLRVGLCQVDDKLLMGKDIARNRHEIYGLDSMMWGQIIFRIAQASHY